MIITEEAKIVLLNPEEDIETIKALFLYKDTFYIDEASLAIASDFKLNNRNVIDYPWLFKLSLLEVLKSMLKENKDFIGFIFYKEKNLVNFELWCIGLTLYKCKVNKRSDYLFSNKRSVLNLTEKIIKKEAGNKFNITNEEEGVKFGIHYGWNQLLIAHILVIRLILHNRGIIILDKNNKEFKEDFSETLEGIKSKAYASTNIWFKDDFKIRFNIIEWFKILIYTFKNYLNF